MGLFNKKTGDEGVPDLNERVRAFDAYGREIEITKAEWRDKILIPNLKKGWGDSLSLYEGILQAFQDGFFKDVVPFAQRMHELESGSERSSVVLAIALMKSGKVSEAEKVLNDFLKRNAPTGTILTNLSKVYFSKGETQKSEDTLWKAMELDPNQNNGLDWWLAVQKEKGGPAAYHQALEKIAKLPGSWRAQLWLGVECLKQKNLQQARTYFEHCLHLAGDEPDVFLVITGELGRHGHLEEILNWILPLFDPAKHDPRAGTNILEACHQRQKIAEGRALLEKLFALNLPHFKEVLTQYADAFDKLTQSPGGERAAAPVNNEPEFMLTVVDRPLWFDGLADPGWVLPKNSQDIVIGLVSWGQVRVSPPQEVMQEQEDDLGRLTRSIPLYLFETLLFQSNVTPKVFMPLAVGLGPVVFGEEWVPTADELPLNGSPLHYLVTGMVRGTAAELTLQISVWDVKTDKELQKYALDTTLEKAGEAVLQIKQKIFAYLKQNRSFQERPGPAFYGQLDPTVMNPYLLILSQTLALYLVKSGFGNKEGLFGVRNMIQNPLSLALHMRGSEIPLLHFFANLSFAYSLNIPAYHEFRQAAFEAIKEERSEHSLARRLAPVIYRIYDQHEELLLAEKNAPSSDADYKSWLRYLKQHKFQA